MKKFSLIAILFAMFISLSFAQTATETTKQINVDKSQTVEAGFSEYISLSSETIACDSGDYEYTDWFTIPKYDGTAWGTYPIVWWKLQSSATAKPHISAYIEGTYDYTNTFNVDTLGAKGDSLETFQKGSVDFNGIKALAYRFKFVTEDANPLDALISTIGLGFIKPED